MLTAPMLTNMMTTHQIVIHPAMGTAVVQKLITVFAACNSFAIVMQNENQYDHPRAKAAERSTNLPGTLQQLWMILTVIYVPAHWTKADGNGYITANSPMECETHQIMLPARQ